MRKYTPFVIAASIILLTVVVLSACGEAARPLEPPQEVSPAPATPTAPAPTPAGRQVVLAEMFTGDW